MTWRPDNRTELTLLGCFQCTETRFPAPIDAFGTVFSAPGVGRIPQGFFIGEPSFDKYNINSGTAGYLFTHEFDNNLKFSSKFRYYEAQADGNYLTFLGFDTSNPRDPQIVRGVSQRLEHSSNYTTDNNLQYKFATGSVTYTAIAGVDFVRSVYATHRLRRGDGGELDLYDPVYGVSLPVVSPVDTGFHASRWTRPSPNGRRCRRRRRMRATIDGIGPGLVAVRKVRASPVRQQPLIRPLRGHLLPPGEGSRTHSLHSEDEWLFSILRCFARDIRHFFSCGKTALTSRHGHRDHPGSKRSRGPTHGEKS